MPPQAQHNNPASSAVDDFFDGLTRELEDLFELQQEPTGNELYSALTQHATRDVKGVRNAVLQFFQQHPTYSAIAEDAAKAAEEFMEDATGETLSAKSTAPASKKRKLSVEEVEDLIREGEDLYRSIPGDCIPTETNMEPEYARYLLSRFIDSGASDIAIESRKRDGKVARRVMFRIS